MPSQRPRRQQPLLRPPLLKHLSVTAPKRSLLLGVAHLTLEFVAYEERFLTSVRDGRNKSGFSIHTEVLQLLRNVVSDLRVETSITSYIENIILDHLKTHQELLNQIASQRRRDKTIDL